MGNPVFGAASSAPEPSTSSPCPGLPGIRPARRLERNPFRRRPTTDNLELPDGDQRWSVWTRNIRQRAEILHTDAPNELGVRDSGETSERSASEGRARADAAQRPAENQPKHRYTLRLGYDPRIFLEDPALRGQKLTPEAEAWAAEYRTMIPMTTDPQLARRLEPEASRLPQVAAGSQPRHPVGAHPRILQAVAGIRTESSDEDLTLDHQSPDAIFGQQTIEGEQGLSTARLWRARVSRGSRPPDEPPVRLALQQLAAGEPRLRSASSVERLNMLGEAISAATWELSDTPPSDPRQLPRRNAWAPHEARLASRGSPEARFRELQRLLNEAPDIPPRRQVEPRQREADVRQAVCDKQSAEECGAQLSGALPLNLLEDLLRLLRSITRPLNVAQSTSRRGQVTAQLESEMLRVPCSKQKVIVADDVLFNRKILSRVLVKLGYQVLEASTGEEAVEAFRREIRADARSDLLCVLLDINMPIMDGLEAALRIRELEAQLDGRATSVSSDEATVPSCSDPAEEDREPTSSPARGLASPRRVPIWAVSACSDNDQYRSPALAAISPGTHEGPPWKLAGFDAFMVKPVDTRQLTTMISSLQLELSQPKVTEPGFASEVSSLLQKPKRNPDIGQKDPSAAAAAGAAADQQHVKRRRCQQARHSSGCCTNLCSS